MAHIASTSWLLVPVDTPQWFIASIYEITTRFCVPSFFFATGAVLLNPRKNLPPPVKIARYCVSALTMAALVSVLFVFAETRAYGWLGWRDHIRRVIDAPYFIWYLWVLAGLYLVMPIMRLITRDERVSTYTCSLLLVFVIDKSTVISMFPGFLAEVLADIFLLFNRGSEGIFYCLFGAWFVSHHFARRASRLAMFLACSSLLVAIGMNALSALSTGQDLYYVDRGNLLIYFFSLGVFLAFSSWEAQRPLCKLERKLCDCGLLIYLIHPFFRLLFKSAPILSGLQDLVLGQPLIFVPLESIAYWALSFVCALFCRLIKSRLLVRMLGV